jgi:hypothetical protein
MTNLPSGLICGFGGLSLVCGIAVALLSFINKKRFSAICMLYKEKFGSRQGLLFSTKRAR